MKQARIGDMLIQRGAVSEEMVKEALRRAAKGGGRLGSQLLDMGACDEQDLAKVLAEKHGVPGVDLSRSVILAATLKLIPRAVAETDLMLALSVEGDRLHVAVPSPSEGGRAIAEVRFVTGREVSPYIAVTSALQRAITQAYDAVDRGEPGWRGSATSASASPSFAVHQPPGEPLELNPDEYDAVEAEDVIEPDEAVIEVGEELGETEIVVDEEPSGSVGAGAAASARRRVLVVDDEPEIRLLAQRILENSGYTVETAVDGVDALEKIERWHPDLVLLDAMLPRLHGFEVCRRVKSDPRTRDLPVMIMTAVYRGWRFANDVRESYGAADYLEKPFNVTDLVRRVGAVLSAGAPPVEGGSAATEPFLKQAREQLSAGKAEEAAEVLGKVILLDPFSVEAHHLLAKAHRARGDLFQSMSAFERAVELRPTLLPAMRSLATLYVETGFRRKATEMLERAMRAAPDEETRTALQKELLKLLTGA